MKSKNHCTRAYDGSSEAFWCNECNEKNPGSFEGTVLEKIKKNHQKYHVSLFFFCFFLKAFYVVFPDFIQNGTFKIARVFCAILSALIQNPGGSSLVVVLTQDCLSLLSVNEAMATLLKCWNTEMLKYWNAEMLKYRNTERLKIWNADMLICWNAEMLR